jgi:hypothetical protein
MSTVKEDRIEQIRRTLRKVRREFMLTAGVATVAYLLAAVLGLSTFGWVAFIVAVAASFLAVLTAVAMASWELEANILEGPRTD